MQNRNKLIDQIISHMHTLFSHLNNNKTEVADIISRLKTKNTLDAIDYAWNIINMLEKQNPKLSQTIFMQTRIELHAIQDEYYLLEVKRLLNENGFLAAKLNAVEQEKHALQTKMEKLTDNHAAVLLALRRQQQITEKLRVERQQRQKNNNDYNPHSPYMSPSFAQNNEE